MDKENLLNNPHFFPSPPSTKSETDDDDFSEITRCFSRSLSLQEPLKFPYNLQRRRGFSASPESTLNWQVFTRCQLPAPSPEEDAWDLIYAAGQVARMRMRLTMKGVNAGEAPGKYNGGLFGAPRSLAYPQFVNERNEWFLKQKFQNRGRNTFCCCAGAGGGGGVRPLGYPRLPPWPPLQAQNQRHQHHHCTNQHQPVKLVLAGGSGGGAVVKRQCAGTGVFLPRRYTNNPPESQKKQACSPAKSFESINAQARANMNGGFVPHLEMMMGGVVEAPASNGEVELPQEWTY